MGENAGNLGGLVVTSSQTSAQKDPLTQQQGS